MIGGIRLVGGAGAPMGYSKAYGAAVAGFVGTCTNANPHNPANGAYGQLLRACRLAMRVGLTRNELLRDVSGAVNEGRLKSGVLCRWVNNAWETVKHENR